MTGDPEPVVRVHKRQPSSATIIGGQSMIDA
jgi:hypothetical protein